MTSSPTTTGDGPRQALLAWVQRKARGLDGVQLTGSTPLLETRYLRSLQIPELLLFLEDLRGTPVDVTQLRPGDFADIDTICARFLTDPPSEEPDR